MSRDVLLVDGVRTSHPKAGTELNGEADAVVAGGDDSMSNVPFFFPRGGQRALTDVVQGRRNGARVAAAALLRPRHFKPEIGLQLGLSDPTCGLTVERLCSG